MDLPAIPDGQQAPPIPPTSTRPTRQRPPPAHPKEIRDICQALYVQGLTPTAISAQTAIPISTVQQWANRGGWKAIRDTLRQNRQLGCTAVVSRGLLDASKMIREDLASELQHQVKLLRANPARKTHELATRNGHQGRAAVAKTLADAAAAVFCWQTEAKVGLIAPMPDAPPIDVDSERIEPAAVGLEPAPPQSPDSALPAPDSEARTNQLT